MKQTSWQILSRVALLLQLALLTFGVEGARAQTAIDSFTQACPASYNPFGSEQVRTQGCYGIYSTNSSAVLTSIECVGAPQPLRIQYRLPQKFRWGNWVSVRREFTVPIDLSGAEGFEVTLRVEKASGAEMRMTLSDIDPGGDDDMWWFDFDPELLSAQAAGITVSVPFTAFRLCYGAGCRINDRRLDLTRIIAYELNFVSGPGRFEEGIVIVESLRLN